MTDQDFETPRDRRHHDDSDALGYDHYNPANMASWAGQPAIKGSSEGVRMVLLTFVTIGITYVVNYSSSSALSCHVNRPRVSFHIHPCPWELSS